MAGGHGFASHGGITLSKGWLYQRWKPLDISGTHLHSATQLLIIIFSLGIFIFIKLRDFYIVKHLVLKD